MKIKDSVSSTPSKVLGGRRGAGGGLFLKKALHEETNFIGEDLLGESFTNGNSFEFSSNLNSVDLRIFPGYDERDSGKYIFTSL